MDIILIRHAEAEDTSPDAQRKLTQKGKKDAAKTAKWLLERIPKDFILYSSDLVRAKETARFLGKEPVIIDELLPGVSPQRLLDRVSWPYDDSTVVLVGHQPQMGHVAAFILGSRGSFKTRKSSIWWFKGDERETELFCHVCPAGI